MNCEMCGKETELYKAVIEGTPLQVCEKCANHGKILKEIRTAEPKKIRKKKVVAEQIETETTEGVVDNYAKIIRIARTKTGMTQKEFARKINEKESLLHKLETGNFKPSIPLEKKLEKILHIKLIEEREEEKVSVPKAGKSEALTIGDLMKR